MAGAEAEARFSYTVAIKQDLVAQHYLIGEASESEKRTHSHRYQVEVQLDGRALNEQGYLVDIDEIDSLLKEVLVRYEDKTLNDLPEFKGLNPSIEHLARTICHHLSDRLKAPNVNALTVRVWETANAWGLYRQDFPCESV